MFEYVVEGQKFGFNYTELREQYHTFVEMEDEVFIQNLVDAAHFASFVCFFKNIPTYVCLSDMGIVHELIHLMKDNGTTTPLSEVRKLFKEQLKLS